MNAPIWFSNLFLWSAQVAVLTLAAALLPRILQVGQPRVLLAYWRAVLALSLLLPWMQSWHQPKRISLADASFDFAVAPPPSAPNPNATHWHLPSLQSLAEAIAVVILVGIAVRFVILAMGLLRLRQFRKASSPIFSSDYAAVFEETSALVQSRAEFRISADVLSPVTFGFAAPVILLPESFPSMAPRFQSTIACHELLHVRRNDWAHHLFEELIRAAFWFHPAIGWLIARVRLAREHVVDFEVVRLTNARKTYLEALLAFTRARTTTAAIPAPPFLAERQLAERVSLMLKEVRMSRTRLIASLAAISSCLALTAVLAVWVFPLKAAARLPQNPPQGGIAQGVSSGVSGGVAGGVSGGVSGGTASGLSARGIGGGVSGGVSDGISHTATGADVSTSGDIPTVDNNTIWTDTVKRGPMVRQVRGLGTLVNATVSTNLTARIMLPESMTKEVHANQRAAVSTEKGPIAAGHVISVGRKVANGEVAVEISLDEVPKNFTFGGAVPERVDATIDIEKIDDVLYVGRPVHGAQNSTISIFKIAKDGAEAVRVNVKLGRASVNTIEVLDGLKAGDKVILSDMSTYDNADRVLLK